MSAFDDFNETSITDLIEFMALKTGRMRSFGPCPVCSAERRSKSDRRLALGVTPNYKGWHCHKCKASGNMVDLLCYSKIGSRYNDASEESKTFIAF